MSHIQKPDLGKNISVSGWDDDSLTWALISAIQDDKGIKQGLYPPPGQNVSTAQEG
ncbi:hypothetical protein WOLCODRAFT_78833 [Wolfiporia cocos MD-104 SS10]|uniref:Uncharacterized protein n=1 Tax=Wolfiporia cocos (strain MD-104) TaxID=742152 RepID=A0A2H3IY50_WOLCO|nr:hypothetical protein WOLCODRAFT_78833 [Wolfiporia cocos MD-104 SS10]